MHYIIYLGYGLWNTTGTAYKVTGGSVQVNASFMSIEVNVQYPISSHLLASFWQCFIGTYARGVLVVAKAGQSQGAVKAS